MPWWRHGDLRAGVGVEHGVGLAGDGRAVGVDDGQDLTALLTGMAHGLDGVHGLAGLGDGHGEGLLADDGVAVAELVGEFDLHGDAAPVLDGVLGDVPGVGGGAAGDDDDLVDAAQNGGSMRISSSWSSPRSSTRPRRVSATAAGCSWISLSMKVS